MDGVELMSAFSTVSAAGFMIVVLIDLLLRLLSAYRWHVLFVALHKSSPIMEIIRISFVAGFLGQAMPGVIGVEALRIHPVCQPASIQSMYAINYFSGPRNRKTLNAQASLEIASYRGYARARA